MCEQFVQWFIVSIAIFAFCRMSVAYHPLVHKQITEEAIQRNLANINERISDYIGLSVALPY